MKKFFSLLLLCIAVPALSQINFEKGYFINNQGQTIDCLIKNLAWKNNPVSFEYKLTEGDTPHTAVINDVEEFNVSGYKFKRHAVGIDRSSKDIDRLSSNKEPEFKQETLFLKVLIEGKATLYQYEDGNLVRYFYSGGTEGAVTTQLIYKEYKVGENIGFNNQFRGQLYYALKDGVDNNDRFKDLRYDKSSLVKVFLEYNGEEKATTVNLSNSQNKSEFHLKVTPGVNYIDFRAEPSGIDFGSKLAFRLGFEFEVVLPFNNKKWSLFTDPNYSMYSNDAVKLLGSGSFAVSQTWNAEYNTLEIPLGARHYMYLTNKARIFINAAYVLALPLGKAQLTLQTESTNPIVTPIELTKSSSFALGAGFAFDKFSGEIRYNFTRQVLNNYVFWRGEYKAVNLILGYRIF